MKYVLATLGILAVVGFMIVSTFVGTYNRLIKLQTDVDTQYAQIETQLQRRFDLIPSLVGAVKGTLKQEQKVFGDIAAARTQYAGAPSKSQEKLDAANNFESAIGRLLVIMENYPVLQSNSTVKDLMVQLEGSENRISVARQRYNETARDYNRARRVFPTNFIANLMGLQDAPFFDAVEGAEVAPTVDLTVE